MKIYLTQGASNWIWGGKEQIWEDGDFYKKLPKTKGIKG
jgi:hypothetical protein